MSEPLKIPFYAKASLISIGLFTFVSILYIAQSIIVPVVYATIIAIVLSPLVNFLVKKKLNRALAIAMIIIFMLAGIISTLALLSSQAMMFAESLPKLAGRFAELIQQAENSASAYFNISSFKIHQLTEEASAGISNGSRAMIGQTLINLGSMLVVMVLIPVYVFMILFYQPLLIEFIHKLFSTNKHLAVNNILTATKRIVRSYLTGLLLEAVIVAALNSSCLLVLGIDYAILLGVIGALLNIIPYLGGIVAVALPMLIALATKPPTYALLVLACYIVIQFIDNNFIIPQIVASKVQLNALISVVVVLVGGALWGIPGMFLSIPLTAILKVISDHIDGMKPWGYLFGNIVPVKAKPIFRRRKIRSSGNVS